MSMGVIQQLENALQENLELKRENADLKQQLEQKVQLRTELHLALKHWVKARQELDKLEERNTIPQREYFKKRGVVVSTSADLETAYCTARDGEAL
jgi:cell division septum initiation protein DivIVA